MCIVHYPVISMPSILTPKSNTNPYPCTGGGSGGSDPPPYLEKKVSPPPLKENLRTLMPFFANFKGPPHDFFSWKLYVVKWDFEKLKMAKNTPIFRPAAA